jgi:uncharacterized protein (DUF779 family)
VGSFAAERSDDRGLINQSIPSLVVVALGGRCTGGSPVSLEIAGPAHGALPKIQSGLGAPLWPSRKNISAWREVRPRKPVKPAFLGVPLLLAAGTSRTLAGDVGSFAAERSDDRGPINQSIPSLVVVALGGRCTGGSPVSYGNSRPRSRCTPKIQSGLGAPLWSSRKNISAWREVRPRKPVKPAFLGVPLLLAAGTFRTLAGDAGSSAAERSDDRGLRISRYPLWWSSLLAGDAPGGRRYPLEIAGPAHGALPKFSQG